MRLGESCPVFKVAVDASRAGKVGGWTVAAAQQRQDPGSRFCQPLFVSLLDINRTTALSKTP